MRFSIHWPPLLPAQVANLQQKPFALCVSRPFFSFIIMQNAELGLSQKKLPRHNHYFKCVEDLMRTHNIRHCWPHRMPKSKTRKRAVITKAKTRLFSLQGSFKVFRMDIWCVIFAAYSPQKTIINPGGKLMLTPTRGFSPFLWLFFTQPYHFFIMIIALCPLC